MADSGAVGRFRSAGLVAPSVPPVRAVSIPAITGIAARR
jgi:hypothetical protein